MVDQEKKGEIENEAFLFFIGAGKWALPRAFRERVIHCLENSSLEALLWRIRGDALSLMRLKVTRIPAGGVH